MNSIKKNSERYSIRGKKPQILGVIDEFPFIIHGKAVLKHGVPNNRVRELVIQGFYTLNGREEDRLLSVSSRPGPFLGKQGYTVKIGYGSIFDNFNEKTLEKLVKSTSFSQRFMDFQIEISYHYDREGKKVPLRFDQHLIRHIFLSNKIGIMLVHIKGIRRTPLTDVLRLVTKIIDQSFFSNGFNGVTIEELKAL
jgi:hypothetical protein